MHTIPEDQTQFGWNGLFPEATNQNNSHSSNFRKAEALLTEAEAAILKHAARILAKRSAEIRKAKQLRQWKRLCRIFGNAGNGDAMLTASIDGSASTVTSPSRNGQTTT